MHFTISKDCFLRGLGKVQGIVEKRNTIPILSNVLIEAKNNEVIFTATDLEVGIQTSYESNVKDPGKITVSAKKIYEIVKELPDYEISFKSKDNSWIEIKCNKSIFNIVGLSSDEFPYFPEFDNINFIDINSEIIKEMLEKTSFSISNDETKYNLNGIFIKKINIESIIKLRFVSTDGHRLSLIQKNIEMGDFPELTKGVIIPKKGIMELKKLLDDSVNKINVGFIDNNAIIRQGKTNLLMRLVDGEFPDYDRVIPKENNINIEIDVDNFFHALKRISILASEKSKGVKLSFNENNLIISSSNPDYGDAKEDIAIVYSGPDLSIGFNAKYLLDILASFSDKTFKLSVKDNLSPGLITPIDNTDYFAVVMPMRL
ncbi:DNA polymerase III subunit beta [Desulfuromonas sp. KJ2020]|uniref:DNA polymerase III subunit beta n=1 Tax=Desulfuromonas sp. KJ2020 TaxID=2919173 RepID=UPI0020A7DFB5|nr:DNA polymerase III subunit beta [Desulfuromonas sp. KJ2020]MCP3176186.1 DNA polymerase III subunit beta [Desulfuromonas sp. KJ2020]